MKSLGIRNRILLVSLAPAILVAFLVSGMLVAEQLKQAGVDQHRRLSAVAKQLVAAARYSLFVGNQEGLVKLLESARSDPNVLAAAFLDSQGKLLAISPATEKIPEAREMLAGFDAFPENLSLEHWHSLTIAAEQAEGFDWFEGAGSQPAPQLGRLLLKISNASLRDDMRRYIATAALISVAMLIFGVLLALTLSRGLIRGLADIGRVVEGVGQGRNARRIANPGSDELGHLARGINIMADAVEQTQETLATRIQEATATLRRERDEAETASQARSRFFAAASHDLRQPVQALGLFISRLEHDAQNSPLQPRVRKIGETIRNLQTLLDTLLDFSRLDGQTFPVKLGPVNASTTIANLIESFSGAAMEKNLSLRARIADCWLMTDPMLLHRILSNLIANAIRHSQRGGILVACRRESLHARIEVWDTGPGIPPEHHQSIFEEFVQLDNPERDTEKGLGLGLAIVRRTADLLSCPLTLCSHVGHGSRFAIHIPLTTPPAAAVTKHNSADGASAHSQILIIGQATSEVRELASTLRLWGFTVDHAADAAAARTAIADRDTPEILICCAQDGAEGVVLAQTRLDTLEADTGCSLPALIISSGPAPALEERPGAPRLLLSRPFRPARLRALLNRLATPTDDLGDHPE